MTATVSCGERTENPPEVTQVVVRVRAGAVCDHPPITVCATKLRSTPRRSIVAR